VRGGVLLVPAVAAVPAATGPAAAEQLRLISLATAATSEQTTVDVGAPGASAGDLVIWHGPVVDEAGTAVGTCVRASAREDVRHCT
jgi:hypothetical protein